MPWRLAVQLPETLDLRHRQIVAAQMQPGIKEHAAVTGGENEVIAIDPARLVGVMFQRIAVEDCAHFRAAQRQAKMAGLRSVNGVDGKAARLVGRARKDFEIQTHAPESIRKSFAMWKRGVSKGGLHTLGLLEGRPVSPLVAMRTTL